MSSIPTVLFHLLLINWQCAGCSFCIATVIGAVVVRGKHDWVEEGSPQELVSIVKRGLLIQAAGVVHLGNPIYMSHLLVRMSQREITEDCLPTNLYSPSMGLSAQ